jgi:hypothetical protein
MSKPKKEESKEKQRKAYDLYIKTELDFDEIADIVGVTAKTLRDWRKEKGWDKIKEASEINAEALVATMQAELHDELVNGIPVYDKKTGLPVMDEHGVQRRRRITKDEISKAVKAINDLRDNRVLMSHRYLTLKEFLDWHALTYPANTDERKRLGDITYQFTKDKANGK